MSAALLGYVAIVASKVAASKRGRGSRNKGQRKQRCARDFVADILGKRCKSGIAQCRGGAADDGADVEIVGDDTIHIEVKGQKKPNWRAAYAQAKDDAAPGKMPVALCQDDRGPWMVIVDGRDFFELYRDAYAYRNSVAIELVVGTEEDEAAAEKALWESDAEAKNGLAQSDGVRTLPLFGGAS